MSLRILEDKERFRFHKLDRKAKEKILDTLRKLLSSREEIVIAAVYGGFIEYNSFHDIDVGVYTGYKIPYEKTHIYQEELSTTLSKTLGYPVDVRVIDYAPTWFRVKVLEGIVIVEKTDCLATRLKFKYLQELNDIILKKKIIENKSL